MNNEERLQGLVFEVISTSQDPDMVAMRRILVRAALADMHNSMVLRDGGQTPIAVVAIAFLRVLLHLDEKPELAEEFKVLAAYMRALVIKFDPDETPEGDHTKHPDYERLHEGVAELTKKLAKERGIPTPPDKSKRNMMDVLVDLAQSEIDKVL